MIGSIINQPSIEISGITIQEPITSLTDLLVSLTCFILYLKVHRMNKTNHVYRLFKYFFITMSISTLSGGLIGHAFFYAFDFKWKLLGWIVGMISVMFIERATIFHARPLMGNSIGKIFRVINIFELAIFIAITISTLNFYFVEIHMAYGFIIVVFSFELFVYLKTKDKGSRIFMLFVLLAAITAAVHISKFSIGKWFNYLDISHVLMIISAIVLYKGIEKMQIFES